MRVDGQAVSQDVFPVKILNKIPQSEESQQDNTGESQVKSTKTQVSSTEDLQEAMDFANSAMKMSLHHLEFVLPEDSDQYQVKVVDSDSGDVIREIPPDYMMKISEQLQKNINQACGLMVDELA